MGLLSFLDKIVVGDNPLKPSKEKSGGLLEKVFGGAKAFGDLKLFSGDNKQQPSSMFANKATSENSGGAATNNGGSSNWNAKNTHDGFYSAGKTSDNRPLNNYSAYSGVHSYSSETSVVEVPVYLDRLDDRDPFYEIHNPVMAEAAAMGGFESMAMNFIANIADDRMLSPSAVEAIDKNTELSMV